jgi:predicted outer membrane protein
MMTRSAITRSTILGVALATVTYAWAQQQQQQPNNDQTAPGQTTTERGQTDRGQTERGQIRGATANGMRHDAGHYMKECLIGGNQAEIALARIAEQRATDPEVKKFAQQMIEEHTAFLNKLRGETSANSGQATPGQNAAGQPTSDPAREGKPGVDVNVPGAGVHIQAGESRDSRETPDGNRLANPQMAGGARQFLQIMKEVETQCLQTKTNELNQKEGSQFDRCYIGGQVAAHMKMADELSVFSRYATGDLQPILQEGLQTTKQHLAHVKQLAERLENASGRSANREGTTRGQ